MRDAHRVSQGRPHPLGVTADAAGINVAVFSAHATAILFCLFDGQDREIARIALPERTGDIFHGHIAGIHPGARYGLRAEGPFAPREGHRFNAHKLLLDPHAALIDRPFVLHPAMFGHLPGHPDADLSFNDADSAPFMPKAVVLAETAPLAPEPLVPWSRTIIYEMHLKGYTKLHPDVPEALRGTFAGLAQPEPLRHLTDLGVSSVELLPVAAWLDERHLGPLGLTNYWGYNPVAFGAPDPRLAPRGWDEIAASVGALAAEGIETILDVVLNHSGEGDELGPTVSLRGLDNASYYRLDPTNPRLYANDAGCGNTLALERPPVLRLAMDSLRRFACRGGVHGFRFDLATTLGRRENGFDPDHPLLAAIAQDPVLGRLKLIAEPWDIGMGGYQLGRFPSGWGEWNDRFRDTTRRFWRGDAGMLGEMATRLAGSADVFSPRRRPLSRGINFITAHDGFTLADLVSYSHKHNAANGEQNRDGTDANHSWNNGCEGTSEDPAIRARRGRDQRALMATLLLARGTPMLAMGDEMGRSQAGNNNAYAQDNQTSWLDWSAVDPDLLADTRRLIALRLAHPALCEERPLTGLPVDDSGHPDVAWLRADGAPMTPADWNDPSGRLLIAVFYAAGSRGRVLVALNAAAGPSSVALPQPDKENGWIHAETGDEVEDAWTLPGRTTLLLLERPVASPRRRTGVDGAALSALAAAAGIAPDWWEVSGTRHVVSPDVHKALLRAMNLPAETTGEARASLMRLAAQRDHRALPLTMVAPADRPITIELPPSHGRRIQLCLEAEDGSVARMAIAPGDGEPVRRTGCDGRPVDRRRVQLPARAAGFYRLFEESMPETDCRLIVAPAGCWRPAMLDGRPFGVAAQLYSLRREGDQGIGDFTTLARFGRKAAENGAALLGLNPLHALFGQDRSRASPYHPSDRRFLDPIYLDVTAGPFAHVPGVRAVLAQQEAMFAQLSRAASVDYPAVWTAKQSVLRAAFDVFEHSPDAAFAAERADFEGFIAEGGDELARFAAFEAISEDQHGKPWWEWPQGLREVAPGTVADVVAQNGGKVRFAQFQQWLTDRALGAAASATGLGMGLYRDLAVGAAPDGAESWACQDILARGVSIGAPPDPFAADGQVWALPAPDPLGMKRDGYRSFAHLLRANMRHAGALRIDHAMGLARLFWVPDGAAGRDGAYVAYDFSEQLGVLALESQRARCMVIGEDLGTVPEGFRERTDAAGVLSYRVLWLERDAAGFRRPKDYPANAAACVGTHDLPTLAGWWEESDIDELQGLGLVSSDASDRLRRERADERAMLVSLMAEAGMQVEADGPLTIATAASLHRFLAMGPSVLKLVQADDLAGERARINLPGTDRERANWRRKLTPGIAELLEAPLARAILEAMLSSRAERSG